MPSRRAIGGKVLSAAFALRSCLNAPGPIDTWDAAARKAKSRAMLVDVASAFLTRRQDQALGLAPAQFLPAKVAPLWILYWCAARRVDDSIEEQRTRPAEWRERVNSPVGHSLAELCVLELRGARELQTIDLDAMLARSLEGVDLERTFDRPRSWKAYLELLDLKSTPTMEIFDALLAPMEDASLRNRHARAFAASAQIGDDCRDAVKDLGLGRCFVTKEELGQADDPKEFVRTARFADRRAELCRSFLDDAQHASSAFASSEARAGATRLHDLWRQAIESGQIRPTAEHLALPQ